MKGISSVARYRTIKPDFWSSAQIMELALAPDSTLLEPLRRKKPTMYFVNSMGDLFHEDCAFPAFNERDQ